MVFSKLFTCMISFCIIRITKINSLEFSSSLSDWTEINHGQTRFGWTSDISNNIAVVSDRTQDLVYIYLKDDITNEWIEEDILSPSDIDTSDDDNFGYDVAVDNNIVVVGSAKAHSLDDSTRDVGAVYIYSRDDNTQIWTEDNILYPSNTADAYCGSSVDISDNSIIIGCSGESMAYIYEYDDTTLTWTLTANLEGDDGSSNQFGKFNAVSIYKNLYAIVGDYGDDDINTNSGAAYIYSKDITTGDWSLSSKLTIDDSFSAFYFGYSVSICNDYAIIGTENGGSSRIGAAYIFKNNGNNNWEQTEYITGSSTSSYSGFGYDVDLNCNDENNDYNKYWAIIGTPHDNNNKGEVYIFELDESSEEWIENTVLYIEDGRSDDRFGISVAASGLCWVAGAINHPGDTGTAAFMSCGTKDATTNNPTTMTTNNPSQTPTRSPTGVPTNKPSECICDGPTTSPTKLPSSPPTRLVLASTEEPCEPYIAVNEKLSWEDAIDYCYSNYGTGLATIIDDDSMEEAGEIMNNNLGDNEIFRFWIGLNDEDIDDIWTWQDGTISDYFYENTNILNDKYRKNCIIVYWSSDKADDEGDVDEAREWKNAKCGRKRKFMCNSPQCGYGSQAFTV